LAEKNTLSGIVITERETLLKCVKKIISGRNEMLV
jgi:hypothetical protein